MFNWVINMPLFLDGYYLHAILFQNPSGSQCSSRLQLSGCMPPPPPLLFCVAKRKKETKEIKSFKAETIKRLSPRSKYYCFNHSRASRIQRPTMVVDIFFQYHGPSTLKSISLALVLRSIYLLIFKRLGVEGAGGFNFTFPPVVFRKMYLVKRG